MKIDLLGLSNEMHLFLGQLIMCWISHILQVIVGFQYRGLGKPVFVRGRGSAKQRRRGPEILLAFRICNLTLKCQNIHCKPGLFYKQFCMADAAILTSYITFQRNHKEILHTRLMCIYKIPICTFRQDKKFNFVKCLFFSPTSTYALCVSN